MAKKGKKGGSKGFAKGVTDNKPLGSVTVRPSTVAITAGLTVVGAYLLYDLGRSRAEYEASQARQIPQNERMGSVHRRMGGRGRGSGKGVASSMGGRDAGTPYETNSPSSTFANWQRLP